MQQQIIPTRFLQNVTVQTRLLAEKHQSTDAIFPTALSTKYTWGLLRIEDILSQHYCTFKCLTLRNENEIGGVGFEKIEEKKNWRLRTNSAELNSEGTCFLSLPFAIPLRNQSAEGEMGWIYSMEKPKKKSY
jgi:hypothetical protein